MQQQTVSRENVKQRVEPPPHLRLYQKSIDDLCREMTASDSRAVWQLGLKILALAAKELAHW